MISQRATQDLFDASIQAVRREIPDADGAYATVASGGTVIQIDGTSVTSFLKYADVGTLEDGDVVEVIHTSSNDKRRPTVVGKILSTRTQIGQSVSAYKTATESVTSSTVLQADDTLLLSVVASAVYAIRGVFILSGNDTADFKYNFTFPSGAKLSGGQHGLLNSVAGGVATSGDGDWRALSDESTPSTALLQGIADTNLVLATYSGLLVVSSTAGVLTLQWAQNASDPTATVMRIGSHLIATRIA